MKQTRELLDNIRKSIGEDSMSFIVGAGFSRNISEKFPLWGELLSPLVEEMYPGSCVRNPKRKEARIKQIIAEKTYLGIASEYVRRKGYHEAIDLHIERMMPYLRHRGDNGYDLMINGEVVDSAPSLECHQKLLSLNAKHIFTFNYDNTLDILADVDVSDRLLKQQVQAEEKAQEYVRLQDKYESEYEKLQKDIECWKPRDSAVGESVNISDMVDFSSINEVIRNIGPGLDEYCDDTSDFQSLRQRHLQAIENNINFNKRRAESAKEQRMSQYQLVTDAYQISLTDGCKNIYKLHGNLKTSEDISYGFDGDRHMQYVITQEDYDAYPQKHEAFVNLMRISLLKGNFCLIGFSGDDPNFMGWINWIKDILDAPAYQKMNIPRTVYYINAEDKDLEASKILLLEHHYIKVVNLHCLFPEAKDRRERILRFLDYLGKDKVRCEEYDDSWRRIDVARNNLSAINELSPYIEQVYGLSGYNRIPDQFGLAQYHRSNLFARISSIIKADVDPELRSKLIYSAIKGELMPVNAVLTSRQIGQLSKCSQELKNLYRLLQVRTRVLNGELVDERADEWMTYETIVSRLFNLKFDEADKMLTTWSPKCGINQMRRFMMQSVFEKEIDGDAITGLINPSHFDSIQDFRFAIDLLPQIRGLFMERKGGGISVYEDLQQQREALSRRYPDLVNFRKQIDRLLGDMIKDKSKPFGNIKESFTFGNYNKPLVNSTKVLQILLELAMPTKSKITILMDREQWLKVFENLYEQYPQPCLYFSLLYGNEKDTLRRIAQRYIYSIKLKDRLPELLEMMLAALIDQSCPSGVKDAIYIVAPVFMRAVSPDRWQALFEKFYDSSDLFSLENGKLAVSEAKDLILSGVRLSVREEFRHKVLQQNLHFGDKITSIHNSLIIAASKNLEINDVERGELKHLVECAKTPVQMYVLMNMSKWIGRDVVTEKLCSLDDALYDDCVLLKAACQYAQDNQAFQLRLKNIILKSPRLWQTGIGDSGSSVSHYGYTLDICDIQQYIRFDENELREIYGKLKVAFLKIDSITRKWQGRKEWNFLNDWSYILVEMQNFLRLNKNVLKCESDYQSLSRSVTRLLNQGRGGNSISSLLLDDERSGKAITWMVEEVYENGAKSYQYEYMLLVNKILSRQSKYLNSCFIHFGWALTQYSDSFDRKQFKHLLKSVLEVYKDYFIGGRELDWDMEYAEKDVVERELRKIYRVYESWGGYDRFWSNYIPRYYGN